MTDTARRILLGIFLLGAGGLATELMLRGHYEELVGLAVTACAVPALKASRVDPMSVLRAE